MPKLKYELQIIGFAGCTILLFVAALLHAAQQTTHAAQWLLQTILLWCFVLQQTWIRLTLNRANANSPLNPALGSANRITLLRGLLISAIGGFLFQNQGEKIIAWLPAIIYMCAAILDLADGFVARRNQQTSLLGCELDTVCDALGLFVAPLLAIIYGKIHWSYLLLSVAYYIFQWGLSLRRHQGLIIYPIIPSVLRRSLAGFQMGFIALALCPCFLAPLTKFISIGFMIPVLAGFTIDWFVISGRISTNSPSTLNFLNSLKQFCMDFVQPVIRILLAITLILFVHETSNMGAALSNTYGQNAFFSATLIACIFFIALGIAGRISALILLVLLTLYANYSPMNVYVATATSLAIIILLFGSGRYSLWKKEDDWINRH